MDDCVECEGRMVISSVDAYEAYKIIPPLAFSETTSHDAQETLFNRYGVTAYV